MSFIQTLDFDCSCANLCFFILPFKKQHKKAHLKKRKSSEPTVSVLKLYFNAGSWLKNKSNKNKTNSYGRLSSCMDVKRVLKKKRGNGQRLLVCSGRAPIRTANRRITGPTPIRSTRICSLVLASHLHCHLLK